MEKMEALKKKLADLKSLVKFRPSRPGHRPLPYECVKKLKEMIDKTEREIAGKKD